MTVPNDTIIHLSFLCPKCGEKCEWTNQMWQLVEVETKNSIYYTKEIITIEDPCSNCGEYLVLGIH